MDWMQFIADNGINYVTRGPNTKKGEVSIRCPWCGPDDPGHHLGISLTKDAYGCWRSVTHKGKSPARLIQAVLGCSFTQARLIQQQYDQADPETLDQALEALTGTPKPAKQASSKALTFPSEFRRMKPTGSTKKFWRYLSKRGFDPEYLDEVYDIRCCMVGEWKDRIIIPIYLDNELVCWQGRAITKTINAPRYKALAEDEGAKVNINELIFNEDGLSNGGNVLFCGEGPFDALKIDCYGAEHGAYGTCVFGTQMSLEQAAILSEIGAGFKRKVLLFDPEATESTFISHEYLESSGFEIGNTPEGTEDPGAMSEREIKQFVRGYLS